MTRHRGHRRRNMFGDILSDAASVLPGSLGLMCLWRNSGGVMVRWDGVEIGGIIYLFMDVYGWNDVYKI